MRDLNSLRKQNPDAAYGEGLFHALSIKEYIGNVEKRALQREKDREAFKFKTEKNVRICKEIIKSTLASTYGSIFAGAQFYSIYYDIENFGGKDLLDTFLYVIGLQVYFSLALVVVMMIDNSRLEMAILKAENLPVTLVPFFAVLLVLLDIACEVMRGTLVTSIQAYDIAAIQSGTATKTNVKNQINYFATLGAALLSTLLDVDEVLVALYQGDYLTQIQKYMTKFDKEQGAASKVPKTEENDTDANSPNQAASAVREPPADLSPDKVDQKRDADNGAEPKAPEEPKKDKKKLALFALRFIGVFVYFLLVTTPTFYLFFFVNVFKRLIWTNVVKLVVYCLYLCLICYPKWRKSDFFKRRGYSE
jgi:NADH:ubiquinone oxidoreductase subunit 3 (subunit A)